MYSTPLKINHLVIIIKWTNQPNRDWRCFTYPWSRSV